MMETMFHLIYVKVAKIISTEFYDQKGKIE